MYDVMMGEMVHTTQDFLYDNGYHVIVQALLMDLDEFKLSMGMGMSVNMSVNMMIVV